MVEKVENKRYGDSSQTDEIDIRKLFQSLGNFFLAIWHGIIHLIVMIRRETLNNIRLFGILIFISILLSVVLNKTAVSYYQSSMLMNSSILRGQIIETVVTKLNLLCGESDKSELANALNISVKDAEGIRSFSAVPFVAEEEIIQVEVLQEQLRNLNADEDQINSVIDRIQVENKSTYEIVVEVYDNEIISNLDQAILNYFKSNEYISKRLRVNKQLRVLKKSKLKTEAEKLDSLKKLMFENLSKLSERSREGSNNVILAEDNLTNPLSVFREDMLLYTQELELDRQLLLEQELEIVDGFTIYSKPENMRFRELVIIAVLTALAIGYLFIFLKGINSYLSKVEKKLIENNSD